jgi:hypothetical protein
VIEQQVDFGELAGKDEIANLLQAAFVDGFTAFAHRAPRGSTLSDGRPIGSARNDHRQLAAMYQKQKRINVK